MARTRCDEVIVQIIIRDYDKCDRPIGEAISQPVKVFRSQSPDFWATVDRIVAMQEQRQMPPGKEIAPNTAKRKGL